MSEKEKKVFDQEVDKNELNSVSGGESSETDCFLDFKDETKRRRPGAETEIAGIVVNVEPNKEVPRKEGKPNVDGCMRHEWI